MILPQLDQGATYNQIQFSNDRVNPPGYYDCIPEFQRLYTDYPAWADGADALFQCPSDSFQEFPGHSNYVGCAGSLRPADWVFTYNYFPGDPLESPGNGMFYLCSKLSTADVLDGTSNTLFVGEEAISKFAWLCTFCCAYRGERDAWLVGTLLPGSPTDSIVHHHYWSNHYGGSQFLFVDGHVSLLGYSIDQNLFRGLTTRSGGELVGGF